MLKRAVLNAAIAIAAILSVHETMTITTKIGDGGKSLYMGKMIDKDSLEMEAMGTLDELMAVLGIVMMRNDNKIGDKIEKINQDLYLIMGMLSGYGNKEIDLEEKIKYMEDEIERMEKEKGTVGEFLEAGKQLDTRLNWARTVCRRAERRLVALNKIQQIDENILIYINRLSDYLFMIARREEKG